MNETGRRALRTNGLNQKWAAVVGLVAILGSEYVLRDAFISRGASGFQIGMAIAVEWLVALVLVSYWIPKVEGRKLGSIGFRKFPLKYIWISILAYVVDILIAAGVESGLRTMGLQTLRELSPTLKTYGFPLLFGLFLTGTFVEEVFYRGYLIERVTELVGRRWVAGILSWLTFTLVHLRFFGLGPTIEVSVFAAIVVILYSKVKSIWPGIIVHGISDAFGFLIGPFM
jgi:membrane protease YdiL (CAAX protease family)